MTFDATALRDRLALMTQELGDKARDPESFDELAALAFALKQINVLAQILETLVDQVETLSQ